MGPASKLTSESKIITSAYTMSPLQTSIFVKGGCISYRSSPSGKPFAIRKDLTNAEYSLSGVHSLFSSSAKTSFIALSVTCSHDRNSLLTDCHLSFLRTTRLLRFKSKTLSVIAPRLLPFLAVIIVPRKIKKSFGSSS